VLRIRDILERIRILLISSVTVPSRWQQKIYYYFLR
jgi:hypothetical protein